MNIIQMSIDAVILLVVVLVVRLLFMNKLPKSTFLILWGMVALKLMVPPSFYSKFDVLPRLQHIFSLMKNTEATSSAPEAIQASHAQNAFYQQFIMAINSNLVLSIWFIGVIVLALFFIVMYVKSYQEFQTAIPLKNNVYVNEWLENHQLTRPIQIAMSDRITTPLTYKLFKPVIIFPKSTDWTDEKSLQFVLAHEFVHIKRFDVLWKMTLLIILVLHWFNPLVWVMYYLVNRDIELSCDEKVIRQFGQEAKAAYALSLIKLAETSQKMTPYYSNFSKNGIEERIVSIMKLKKTSMLGIAFASVLIIGGGTIFATTGLASEKDTEVVLEIKENEATNEFTVEDTVKNVLEVKGEKVEESPVLIPTSEGDFEITQDGDQIIIKDKK